MTEIELKEAVYRKVIELAVSLKRNKQTMTTVELTKWINENFPDFEHPYCDSRGVPQAAFKRAKSQEAKDALVSVFTSVNGNPIWKEE